jgi:P4 family phage/plasmid primase-like protien
MWEKKNKLIFNYKEDGQYKVYEWDDIKHLFNEKKMFGIIENKNTKNSEKNNYTNELCNFGINENKANHILNNTNENNNDNKTENNTSLKFDKNSKEYEICVRAIKSLTQQRIELYDYWINVFYIFTNDFKEEEAFDLWLKYSKRSTKFISDESLKEKFKKMKVDDNKSNKIHIGSLFEWAKQDDINFYISKQDEYYITKRKINYNEINYYVREAFFEHTDSGIADLINYLYPNYFFSHGELLYFFNQYGIYEKEDVKNKITPHFNKIVIGTLNYLKKHVIDKDLFIGLEETIKEKIIKGYKLIKNKLESSNGKKNVLISFLEKVYDPNLLIKMDEENKNLIGFNNGVYDINKKEFRRGVPSDYVSMTTGYDYIEFIDSAEEKSILQKCYDVINTFFQTKEFTDYFLTTIGYLLHGEKTRQEVYFWLGVGGNGKSLLSLLIKKVLGMYCEFINEDYFTLQEKEANKANGQLTKTKGTRAVFIGEPETGEHVKLQVGKIKKLSSGIDLIKARDLFKENIEFLPQFSLIFLLNDIPELTKLDSGIMRRFIINKFPFMFRKKEDFDPLNPNMKLCDSEISNFMINNPLYFFKLFAKYYTKNFETITEVKEATNEYFEDINGPGLWFKNNYEITNNDKDCISLKELYENYLSENSGCEKISPQKFSKLIIVLSNNTLKTIRRKEGMFFTKVKKKGVLIL